MGLWGRLALLCSCNVDKVEEIPFQYGMVGFNLPIGSFYHFHLHHRPGAAFALFFSAWDGKNHLIYDINDQY